jgi:outer membrane protein assembly factor BamB
MSEPQGCNQRSTCIEASPFFAVLGLLWILCGVPVTEAQSVLTWHNDNARTGQYLDEKALTSQNVNPVSFGKLFEIPVDAKVDAEPLFVEGMAMPGRGRRNVLLVATENDSVYAVDADSGKQFWHVRLLGPGETPSDDRNCSQVTPEIGVTSTPVIDLGRGPQGTIYAVSMSMDRQGKHFQRLHALDLETGAEEFGGPSEIVATFPGNGAASQNGTEIFDPKQYEERAALLLLNGTIYTTWASHCDFDPYNGWVIAYDAATLKQTSVLNFTPNGQKGAVWQSGAGPAADTDGNIYLLAANGTFDTTLDSSGFPAQRDFGNAFLKLSTNGGRLAIADYFAMSNVTAENNVDGDLGSSGPLVLPEMTDASGKAWRLVVGAGKDRNIYLANRDSMGKFNASGDQDIYQELVNVFQGGDHTGNRSAPAYFDGRLYDGALGQPIREFRFANARLRADPVSVTSEMFAYPGATPSISANGPSNAILWATETGGPAVLHAYDATNLAHELYNSDEAPNGRDHFGAGNKFITPMIADGRVYVGTTGSVAVFGLLPTPR